MTSSRFYERGKQIYSAGWMIEKFSVGREENLDLLEAAVEGSYGSRYFVSGVYDTETDEIVEIQCECPAFWEYDGICKHCVAVLLEYEDYCKRQKLLAQYVLENGKKASPMLAPGRYGAQKTGGIRQRATDREARELLESLSRKKHGHIKEKDMEGTVELEPHLKLDRDQAEVTFRIGKNHKYVVKDIFELAGDIKDHREIGQSGMVGYDAIFKNIETAGAEDIVAEIENYSTPDVLNSVETSLNYLLDAAFVKTSYQKQF